MAIQISGEQEQLVHSLVRRGRFATADEVIAEALRLLGREDDERERIVAGIQQGIEEMRAGRGRPAEDVFDDIRREFDLPPDA